MKIYGYTDAGRAPSQAKPSLLSEVTIAASPHELRMIARFIINFANDIEKHGKNWEHEHLSDNYSEFENAPQFIIYNADK